MNEFDLLCNEQQQPSATNDQQQPSATYDQQQPSASDDQQQPSSIDEFYLLFNKQQQPFATNNQQQPSVVDDHQQPSALDNQQQPSLMDKDDIRADELRWWDGHQGHFWLPISVTNEDSSFFTNFYSLYSCLSGKNGTLIGVCVSGHYDTQQIALCQSIAPSLSSILLIFVTRTSACCVRPTSRWYTS